MNYSVACGAPMCMAGHLLVANGIAESANPVRLARSQNSDMTNAFQAGHQRLQEVTDEHQTRGWR